MTCSRDNVNTAHLLSSIKSKNIY